MDKLPTTTFIHSPDTEVDRILLTARSITNGFYTGNKFVILPYTDTPKDTSRVVLPDIEYSKIENFWERVGKLDRNIPMNASRKMFAEVKNLVLQNKLDFIQAQQLRTLQKNWNQKQNRFWEFVAEIFPKEFKLIDKVEVRVTNFGTISSISRLSKNKSQKVTVYLRSDADITSLASIIIKGLLFLSVDKKYSWRETMGIADFLITNSKLMSVFPDHSHIVNALDNVKENKFAESNKYIKKIGVKYINKPLELSENSIFNYGKNINHFFTARERKILKDLIKKDRIVEFDEIADIIWTNPDDYSLWAMNKTMQRLRNKLVGFGLSQNVLVTKRKQGYYLNV